MQSDGNAKLSSAEVRQCAQMAAEAVADLCPDPEHIITRPWLRASAGFPEPPESVTEYESWKLEELRFLCSWRDAVLELTGRYPATVIGQGYRLPPVYRTIPDAHGVAMDKIARAVSQFDGKASCARLDALTMEERQAAHRARVGVAQFALMVGVERKTTAGWRQEDRHGNDHAQDPGTHPAASAQRAAGQPHQPLRPGIEPTQQGQAPEGGS